jgi:DNA-binding beta-propeller fold protein YncE
VVFRARISLRAAALVLGAWVGLAAAAPAPDLQGTVIVLNKRADTASFIDLATGTIVAEAPTGVGPHELVVTADGRTAIGTDYEGEDEGSLSVFDVATGTRTRVIPLDPYTRPHGIVLLPGDEVAAVTVEAQGAVLLVDLETGAIVRAIPTQAEGSHMVAVTADGETLWTGDIRSDTVTELRATGERVRALPAPDQPEAINVTASGDRVFAGSNGTGRVTVFDTATGEARTVAEGFGWPYRMFLTPGAEQLIVPDLRKDVLRFFDGSSYEELGSIAFPDGGPQGLKLHPDGRHLFLSLSAQDRIAIVDVEKREVVGYLPAGASPDGVGYSGRVVTAQGASDGATRLRPRSPGG